MTFQELGQSIDFSQNHFFIIGIVAILTVTFIISCIEAGFYKNAILRLQKSSHLWDDVLLWSIHKPLAAFIWLFGLTIIAKFAITNLANLELLNWIKLTQYAVVIIVSAWISLRLTNRIEVQFLHKYDFKDTIFDQTSVQAIAQICRALILVLTGLICLKTFFNMPLTGLWAVGGASSFIIGWAAKDLLANFFGAIMLFMDRPFSIGDWIRSSDRQIEGTVEYIGWRLTRIRTFDKRPVYIPNSVFSSICLENASRMQCWRIREMIKIRYEDSCYVNKITQDVSQMLLEHKRIDSTLTCMVNLNTIGSSSLDILVYCFTNTKVWAEYLAIKQDVLLKINDIIHSYGAKLAHPTQTLDLPLKMPFDNSLS